MTRLTLIACQASNDSVHHNDVDVMLAAHGDSLNFDCWLSV